MPIYSICPNDALGQDEKGRSDSSKYVWCVLKFYDWYWGRDDWTVIKYSSLFRSFHIIDWIDKNFKDMIYCNWKEITRNDNNNNTSMHIKCKSFVSLLTNNFKPSY